MPFVRVRFDDESAADNWSFPLKPDQIPIFLIPGILGNGTEYREFIEELRAKGDNRPVFVYCDPLLVPDPKKPELIGKKLSMQEQAQLIADCVQDCLPPGSAPYILAGYSYGCGPAALAADILTGSGNVTHVYLIDGPSPECSKAYFSNPSDSLTTDLINIVKTAIELSSSRSIPPSKLDELFLPEFASLKQLSPQACLERLEQTTLSQLDNSYIHGDTFKKYMQIVKQGINNLMTAPTAPKKKMSKLVSLITNETAIKYGDTYGGWDKYTETLAKVEDDNLVTQNHRTLLQQDTVQALVQSIRSLINQELKPLTLFQQQLKLLVETYCKSGIPSDALKMSFPMPTNDHTIVFNSPKPMPTSPIPQPDDIGTLQLSAESRCERNVHDSGSDTPTTIEPFSDEEENAVDLSASQIVATLEAAKQKLVLAKGGIQHTLFGSSMGFKLQQECTVCRHAIPNLV
ncbi:hypothetical protein AQUSIP_16730 [Aquicella siphonis]|uniref:Thioesterase domain-containing protein n=1 Tax=Aquicella siphonis TaxID=254247 RepID=A0A5E4PJ08_9COXI|nr:thioesterase domain-containing protein [Aquicella siphonis]VVC76362.1 hypothetical protein AQUSIP_16730 [Aquicella siphonis]